GTLKTIHVINSCLISLPISISHCLQAAKHTHIKRLQLIGHFLWHKNDINVQLLCTLQHWRSPVTAIVIKDESTRSARNICNEEIQILQHGGLIHPALW